MTITRGNARILIRQWIDDPNAARWDATNIDLAMNVIYDDGWAEILEYNPWFTSARNVITTANITSPGFIDISVAGNLLTNGRFYRMQKVLRGDREYSYDDPREFVIDQADSELFSGGPFRYWFIADQLWMSPLDDSGETVDLRYSFLPTTWGSLANDSTNILWPDGHEKALIYRAAVELMAKGSAEDTTELARKEQRAWSQLRSYLKRRHPGPIVMKAFGSSLDFGDTYGFR